MQHSDMLITDCLLMAYVLALLLITFSDMKVISDILSLCVGLGAVLSKWVSV